MVIDTNEAAMKAYNWAAKWGGPVAGGVAAGAAAFWQVVRDYRLLIAQVLEAVPRQRRGSSLRRR